MARLPRIDVVGMALGDERFLGQIEVLSQQRVRAEKAGRPGLS